MTKEDANRRFHRLMWPHMATVLRTAKFLLGNAADAEDLAQETMTKAFRFIASFHDGSDARAWLLAILRNTPHRPPRTAGKSLHEVSLNGLEFDPVAGPSPVAATDPADLWHNPGDILNGFSDQQMLNALLDLPEEIRFTLLFVNIEGLDHAQAAELLEVPVGTIKSRAHRGRAMLRNSLAAPRANPSATGGAS